MYSTIELSMIELIRERNVFRYIDGHAGLCGQCRFRDRSSKMEYVAKVALQVEINPGSYKVRQIG